jgi:hypothetical protein
VSRDDYDDGYTLPRPIIRPPVTVVSPGGQVGSLHDESTLLSPYARLVRVEGLSVEEDE